MDLAVCTELPILLHPGPSLCKVASRLSLKWLGWGGVSGLGGGGEHGSTPHDSTQAQAEQRSTVHRDLIGSDEACRTSALSVGHNK
jgi:hypothetical protein